MLIKGYKYCIVLYRNCYDKSMFIKRLILYNIKGLILYRNYYNKSSVYKRANTIPILCIVLNSSRYYNFHFFSFFH